MELAGKAYLTYESQTNITFNVKAYTMHIIICKATGQHKNKPMIIDERCVIIGEHRPMPSRRRL